MRIKAIHVYASVALQRNDGTIYSQFPQKIESFNQRILELPGTILQLYQCSQLL